MFRSVRFGVHLFITVLALLALGIGGERFKCSEVGVEDVLKVVIC